jgi:hypothetical protein
MLTSHWATVHDGRIELAPGVELPEGIRLLVTVIPEEEEQFWLRASESSLADVWGSAEDDAYAQLLDE